MNISKYIRLVVAMLLTGCMFAATAQDQSQEQGLVEEPKQYQVELLLFRNLDQSRTTAEIPRMPKAQITDIIDQDLARADASFAGTDQLLTVTQYWQPLDRGAYQLSGVAGRLDRVDAYELLLHIGWQQTAPDISEALKLDLAELGVDPAMISGTVNLFQQRYLHLALDLKLNDGRGSAGGSGFADAFQAFSASKAIPAIADSRRIRLEELHYFDQPEFGIIARVARAEPSPSE